MGIPATGRVSVWTRREVVAETTMAELWDITATWLVRSSPSVSTRDTLFRSGRTDEEYPGLLKLSLAGPARTSVWLITEDTAQVVFEDRARAEVGFGEGEVRLRHSAIMFRSEGRSAARYLVSNSHQAVMGSFSRGRAALYSTGISCYNQNND